jgi:PAS domain S-box-containing protein
MWVLLSATAIKDAEGNFVASRSTFIDITDRKRAEEAHSRLAAIVESSDDAILSKTLEGTITSWNRGAERIYGYPAEEVVGKPITVLVPPDRPDEIPTILEKVGRGERIEHYETERVKKDGGRLHVSLTVSPIRDSAGNIAGASAVARDITDRKRAEEKIRWLNEQLEERVAERTARLAERESQLKALVGRLVAAQEEERRHVAYEIHDGLTQVAIAAHQHLQVFAEDHPPGSRVAPGELDWALSLAQRVVREARHVIEGLRPTALDDFGLAAALRLMVEELREEGWQVAYEEDLGAQRLNPEAETSLYRVAQEAINNARKHAGTREVRLKLALGRRKVRMEIEDWGRGFDPRAVPRSGGPGERVGLAGMRERIGLLGGELTIISGIDEGTSVVAEVPLDGTGRD